MLSCQELASACASDYIDGQLNKRKRMSVFLHLLVCHQCRRFIRQIKQVKNIVLRRPPAEPTQLDDHTLDQLAQRLLDEYKSQQKK